MNCPSNETLRDYLRDPACLADRAYLQQHIETCPSCAANIALERELPAAFVDSAKLEVPEDVFRAAQWNIESYEHRKRRFRIALGTVAAMIACFASYATRQSMEPIASSKEKPVHVGEPPIESPLPPPQGDAVTIATGNEAIAVPLDTDSVDVSIFMIYPTIPESTEIPDSSFSKPSARSIVRRFQ